MFVCASCGVQHTDGPVCTVCKKQYDYQCSGVTEAGYRKLGERKNSWRCPKCKSALPLSPAPTSPLPAQLDRMQEQLNKIVFQLAPLASLVDDVKSIKVELGNLKDSLEMAHKLIGDFSGTVKGLETRVAKVEKVANDVLALREVVAGLTRELQDRDQFARANNIEVRGIPFSKNENLYDIADRIGKLCNMPMKRDEINYIARIPTRVPNAEKPIVIALNNRYKKEELIASARKLKQCQLVDLGFKDKTGSFYVNDHLTQHNKTLLNKAKSLAKEIDFKYIWVKHCKIMARKSETSPVFFIKDEKDLKKIV